MKKVLSLALALMFTFVLSTNVFATDVDQVITDAIDTVDYQAVTILDNSISKGNGNVYCYYNVNLKSGYKADVTTILQKSTGGDWSEVTRWSHSKVTFVDTEKTKAITQGPSYRIKTYANVYDSAGNFIEQGMRISNTVK